MSTNTYICKTPIKFNKKRYEEESRIELHAAEAQPLLDSGAVVSANPAKPAAKPSKSDDK